MWGSSFRRDSSHAGRCADACQLGAAIARLEDRPPVRSTISSSDGKAPPALTSSRRYRIGRSRLIPRGYRTVALRAFGAPHRVAGRPPGAWWIRQREHGRASAKPNMQGLVAYRRCQSNRVAWPPWRRWPQRRIAALGSMTRASPRPERPREMRRRPWRALNEGRRQPLMRSGSRRDAGAVRSDRRRPETLLRGCSR